MDKPTPNLTLPNPGKWLLIWSTVCLTALTGTVGAYQYLSGDERLWACGTMATIAFLAACATRPFTARLHGVRVEKQALAIVQSIAPDGWRVVSGLPVGDGDLDILVVGYSGARFAIEVKSHENVRVIGWWAKRLTTEKGTRFRRDPLEQARNAAARVGAKPVLWFPKAKDSKPVEVEGVFVVLGGKRRIRQALGLSSAWSIW